MYLFTEDCLIGMKEIDDEHRQLFQLINEAFDVLHSTTDTSVLSKGLLHNLQNYAARHFAHEEAYMAKINDPELPRQRMEHAAFTEKVNNTDASTDLEELLTYLTRWLYRHILSSDMMIGKLPPIAAEGEDPFAFTNNYLTGIELVDEEHKILFSIISDINNLIHEELLHDKYDEIMRILIHLKDYTEVHFRDEEEYMKKINYPGLDAQQRAHTAFVERLVEIDLSELDNMDDNQQEYLEELINFLLAWLCNHILKVDKKIGEFVKDMEQS